MSEHLAVVMICSSGVRHERLPLKNKTMQGGAGFTWIFAQMLSERKISLTALASGNKQRLIKAYRCCEVAPSTDTDTIIQPV